VGHGAVDGDGDAVVGELDVHVVDAGRGAGGWRGGGPGSDGHGFVEGAARVAVGVGRAADEVGGCGRVGGDDGGGEGLRVRVEEEEVDDWVGGAAVGRHGGLVVREVVRRGFLGGSGTLGEKAECQCGGGRDYEVGREKTTNQKLYTADTTVTQLLPTETDVQNDGHV